MPLEAHYHVCGKGSFHFQLRPPDKAHRGVTPPMVAESLVEEAANDGNGKGAAALDAAARSCNGDQTSRDPRMEGSCGAQRVHKLQKPDNPESC